MTDPNETANVTAGRVSGESGISVASEGRGIEQGPLDGPTPCDQGNENGSAIAAGEAQPGRPADQGYREHPAAEAGLRSSPYPAASWAGTSRTRPTRWPTPPPAWPSCWPRSRRNPGGRWMRSRCSAA